MESPNNGVAKGPRRCLFLPCQSSSVRNGLHLIQLLTKRATWKPHSILFHFPRKILPSPIVPQLIPNLWDYIDCSMFIKDWRINDYILSECILYFTFLGLAYITENFLLLYIHLSTPKFHDIIYLIIFSKMSQCYVCQKMVSDLFVEGLEPQHGFRN